MRLFDLLIRTKSLLTVPVSLGFGSSPATSHQPPATNHQPGRGVAIVNGKRVPLRDGSLLLIEKGDTHEIRGVGRAPLKTVNIYVPPAYRRDGEPLPRGRK
jgi:AraC-like protein